MGAGTVVPSDAVSCFSEFLARKRAVRVNFLPEGLSGGRSGIQASPPQSPAGDPLPPCSDPCFPYQAREGGIWAVLRIKRSCARRVLAREGLLASYSWRVVWSLSAPPGKRPPVLVSLFF